MAKTGRKQKLLNGVRVVDEDGKIYKDVDELTDYLDTAHSVRSKYKEKFILKSNLVSIISDNEQRLSEGKKLRLMFGKAYMSESVFPGVDKIKEHFMATEGAWILYGKHMCHCTSQEKKVVNGYHFGNKKCKQHRTTISKEQRSFNLQYAKAWRKMLKQFEPSDEVMERLYAKWGGRENLDRMIVELNNSYPRRVDVDDEYPFLYWPISQMTEEEANDVLMWQSSKRMGDVQPERVYDPFHSYIDSQFRFLPDKVG